MSKYIFITGAASGIGRATAQKFAAEGWQIGAADLNDEGLSSLQAELGDNQCATFHLDVTNAATKFAVKGLTEALAVELTRFDSRAADVLPGLIDTPILNAPHYESGRDISAGERNIGAGIDDVEGAFRLIQPSEVADVVWQAYHTDKVHWYVPPEIEEIDQMKVQDVEAMRDQRVQELTGK